MARGGIYKGEVLRARDKLQAMGRYPSIDAVRLELGNTGSKATIHRYLKEIEEEEGGKTGSKVAISESLHDLVARLSERLHLEAETRITELAAKHADEMAKVRQELMAAQSEAAEIQNALGRSPPTSSAATASPSTTSAASTRISTASGSFRRTSSSSIAT